jgi:hypothetical protein
MQNELTCQSCGAPGFLQHAPPPSPVSGIWCAQCFARLDKKAQVINVLYRFRLLWFFVAVALLVVGQKAFAAAGEFTSAAECVVGKRVVTREKQAGVIAEVSGSGCKVRLDSTGQLDYNIFWMLRPEGKAGTGPARQPGSPASSLPTAGAGSSSNIPPGKYACYLLVGGNLNYAFIDVHIEGGNRYRDKNGKPGTYHVDANLDIRFTGPLANTKGKLFQPGPRIGLTVSNTGFYNTTCSRSQS